MRRNDRRPTGTSLYYDDLTLRFDGETDKTFYINAYSTVQELG